MAVDLVSLNSTLTSNNKAMEGSMEKAMAAASKKDATPADLQRLNMEVMKWSQMQSLQASIQKEVGEAMKGIIQKM